MLSVADFVAPTVIRKMAVLLVGQQGFAVHDPTHRLTILRAVFPRNSGAPQDREGGAMAGSRLNPTVFLV